MEVKVSQAEAVRNFYRKQGAEQERLRIIKLLEAAKGEPHPMLTYPYALELAINAIKEQK